MKYFKKEQNQKKEIKTNFNGYHSRYALRSELGESDGKDINWYNDVYAEPELKYYPFSKYEWYEIIPLIVYSIPFGFFTGLIFLLWFSQSQTLIIMSGLSLSFLIYSLINRIYNNISFEKRITKEFNDLKMIENTEDLCEKDSNGKRYVTFISYDYDEDNRIVELSDKYHEILKKYKFEIDNYISFPNQNKIYDDLYKKSTEILWKDLPDKKYRIDF